MSTEQTKSSGIARRPPPLLPLPRPPPLPLPPPPLLLPLPPPLLLPLLLPLLTAGLHHTNRTECEAHLGLVVFPDTEGAIEARENLLGELLPEVPPEALWQKIEVNLA